MKLGKSDKRTAVQVKTHGLLVSTALILVWPMMLSAQSGTCALVNGIRPEGCDHLNAGTVVIMPVGANTEVSAPTDLGGQAFAISIDAAPADADYRDTVAGAAQNQDGMRQVDRVLSQAGVQVSYDGLGGSPRLAVGTTDMQASYAAGSSVTFRASSNYPAWIARGEVRIVDANDPAQQIAILPIAPNGTANWVMPASGVEQMEYRLRVYDAQGRWDETVSLPLARSARDYAPTRKSDAIVAPGEGKDMAAKRSIRANGGIVTVSGNTFRSGKVALMGEAALPDPDGNFVIQRIMPPGVHNIRIGLNGQEITRRVQIPNSDWFYVGMADLTVGFEAGGENYTIGRIAGYAKGVDQRGNRITASIDTGESDVADLFNELDAKNPRRVIDRVAGSDVYPTFGDDSSAVNDAPTSGKVYLRAENDTSYAMWGDYKLAQDVSRFVRSDRTLYGISAGHKSAAVTGNGDAKFAVEAYAANPDRATQRDVLRGTGGTAYYLTRQDVLSGSETLFVQLRDDVTGNVIENLPLTEGVDYEINYFQGIVTLLRPLSASSRWEGVIADGALAGNDLSLVAQYEYVPTTGAVEGDAYGARAEAWIGDNVRVGVSAAHDGTGIVDNDIAGVDLLLQHSEKTNLTVDVAQSTGPGFDTNQSINGGLDLDADVTAGTATVANAARIAGKADLGEITGDRVQGNIQAHYDEKDAGFVSADYNVAQNTRDYGASGEVQLGQRTALTFSHLNAIKGSDKERIDSQIGIKQAIGDKLTVEAAIGTTDRTDRAGTAAENGTRDVIGIKLSYAQSEDLTLTVFGQATIDTTGGLSDNNRLGLGVETRLNDKLTFEGTLSDGDLGQAASTTLRWDDGAGTVYRLGYQLDPERRLGQAGFSGQDRGTFVVGADQKVNDQLTMRGENKFDLLGTRGSLTQSYGVRYTPSEALSFDGAIEVAEVEDGTGDTTTRHGIALGFDHAPGEKVRFGVRGEYRTETSTDNSKDRDSWLIKAYSNWQTSDNWRVLADVKAIVSENETDALRDGRYVEGNLGYAYRPVNGGKLDALLRYTFLEDLPGPDQINQEGDIGGARQKSHIFSVDANYKLSKHFTLGGKYGFRFGEVAARGSNTFEESQADLAVLRLDYHVVHNWDILLEGRAAHDKANNVQETGAMAGVFRHFGNNVKAGVGYQFGNVSSDLRDIEGQSEGAFFNIVSKF